MSRITSSNNKKNHNDERIIKRAWAKITHLVERKTHSLALSKTAEDIAAEAIEFAINGKVITWDDLPSAEAHLLRVAKKIANWRICDEIKKAKKTIISYALDDKGENEEREQPELSEAEVKYSEKLFRKECEHAAMMEKGRTALAALDAFLSGKGISERDIRIFKNRCLYNMPTDVVCRKHKVTPTNLHKIVSVIKKILRVDGHLLIAA